MVLPRRCPGWNSKPGPLRFHRDGSTSVLPTIKPVFSANRVNPSNNPLGGIRRPPVVLTEQCSISSEYGGTEQWPTVDTRPDRAESCRCNWREAHPSVKRRPFLMSKVWGSTEPKTSVPIMASLPAACGAHKNRKLHLQSQERNHTIGTSWHPNAGAVRAT